ncbi:3'-5' exonuclease [Lysinibacillus sp. BW-2-10]|uniref:HelD family protein n=1 Tax=Lysinibacillus sp. BW-2-10 TaxID=2590030 RepID=UPI00117DE42D|nr:3'-5' exonuclease [Lysinibacillus sp. BW-2-10]TSI09745.1 AAA family ATPase [Lysinibacillus sp. BW-2-10]
MQNEIKKEQLFLDQTIKNIEDNVYLVSSSTENHGGSSIIEDNSILEAVKNEPYFGKMTINTEDYGEEIIYLGKNGIRNKEEDLIVVDWRRPVAKVYYNFTPGQSIQGYKIHINGQEKIETVEVLNKKQIEIKNRKVMKIIQQVSEKNSELNGTITEKGIEVNVTDEVLRSILEEGETSGYLKEIIATIQREQDVAIRQSMDKNVIVQGVAGSGKSSIALHRLSFLLYNHKNLNTDNVLILAPSELFIHSVKDLLPGLELTGIKQVTFNGLVKEILQSTTKLKKSYHYKQYFEKTLFVHDEYNYEFIQFKGSKEFKELLDQHLTTIKNRYREDLKFIEVNGDFLTKEELQKIYDGYGYLTFYKQSEKFIQHVENHFKDLAKQKESLLKEKEEDILSFIKDGELSRSESKEFELLLNKVKQNKKKKLKTQLEEEVTSWASEMKPPNPLEIYNQLFIYLNTNTEQFNTSEMQAMLKHYKPREIDYFDLAPLFYIQVFLEYDKPKYSHIIIDEAQDFSYVHFAALKKLATTMTIIGDIEQSIFMDYGQTNWEEIVQGLFANEETTLLQLKMSYRSTKEVIEVANHVLNKRFTETRDDIVPFSRNGEPVSYDRVETGTELRDKIIETLKLWEAKYKRIAIIHKDEERAKALSKVLMNHFSNVQYVSLDDETNEQTISVIASYNSKGMEFDAVIIVNANETSYPNDDLHSKLLYVAVTRAQKELKIFYQNTPSELLEGLINTVPTNQSELDYIL